MIRRVLLASGVLLLGSAVANATNVDLGLIVNQAAGTWQVTAKTSDLQSLGLASFNLDVVGNDGVTIQKSATVAQTNQAPSPPFGSLRTTGTVNGSALGGIAASQDTVGAFQNNDPSVLGFGFGNVGTNTSATYGSITGKGIFTIAQGRFTLGGSLGPAPSITAQVVNGSFFNLFPMNYAVDDGANNPPLAGTTASTFAAAVVNPITVPVPEPATLLLGACGALGLVAVARRRTR